MYIMYMYLVLPTTFSCMIHRSLLPLLNGVDHYTFNLQLIGTVLGVAARVGVTKVHT